MSWSISVCGTKAAAVKKVCDYLDGAAKTYQGKPEADDIATAKARVIALADALTLDETANAVSIEAAGSHSTSGDQLFSANFKVSVTRTSLSL